MRLSLLSEKDKNFIMTHVQQIPVEGKFSNWTLTHGVVIIVTLISPNQELD